MRKWERPKLYWYFFLIYFILIQICALYFRFALQIMFSICCPLKDCWDAFEVMKPHHSLWLLITTRSQDAHTVLPFELLRQAQPLLYMCIPHQATWTRNNKTPRNNSAQVNLSFAWKCEEYPFFQIAPERVELVWWIGIRLWLQSLQDPLDTKHNHLLSFPFPHILMPTRAHVPPPPPGVTPGVT